MKPSGLPLTAILALAGLRRFAPRANHPIDSSRSRCRSFPYIEIFSPTFFWSDAADFVHVGSTTCPKGRAIAGGVSIEKGKRVAADPGELSGRRVLGGAGRQSQEAGKGAVLAGAGLRAVHAAGGAQGVGTALAAPQAVYQSTRFTAADRLREHDRPPDLSERRRLSSPAASGSTRTIEDRRLPRMELSYPDPDGWNVRAVNGATPRVPPPRCAPTRSVLAPTKA